MQFNVHALDAQQQVVALSLEAASEADARGIAESRGLAVFSIEGKRSLPRLQRTAAFRPALFSIELLSLLQAGLNLVEALQTLAEKGVAGRSDNGGQQVLSGLVASINRGEPFSKAVAAFPEHFSPLYVATIKASERTGNVSEALSRYIAYHDELDKVKKKVVSASIYPAVLVIVGTLVLGFLMFYVVPRFAQVYEDMSHTLPLFSRLLLSFGSFIGRHGFTLFSAFILGVGSIAWALSRAAVRSALIQRLWRLPAVGSRMKTYQLARLYRTAGMLLRAGIPAVRALEMVQDLLAAHLRPQLARARSLIEEGHAMSAALGAAGLATPVAARMMAVGERSGDMGRMLGEIARFHDDEVARFIDWFTRAFEPVLMAVLGVAIGLVVVLMYMPIFELAGSIQ
ncbi:MAG TPA: type II secretion system F family protein [Burkholderiales bacterium]|nr:type II secretion system F family protein [Burkholderiales bacterium]